MGYLLSRYDYLVYGNLQESILFIGATLHCTILPHFVLLHFLNCFSLAISFLLVYQVLQIDDEKKRFVVTLKPKEVTLSDCRELSEAVKGPGLMRSMLKEREEILNEIAHLPGMRQDFKLFFT